MSERTSGIVLPSGRMPKAFSIADKTQLQSGAPAPAATTYRYLRLLQTAAQGSGYLELQRLDYYDSDGAYIVADMTSNTLPSPLVASASEAAFGTAAWMVFSRTIADRWHSDAPSTAEWIKIDLGSGNSARPAAVGLCWNNSTTRFMPSFKVQGSNTGSFAGEEEDIYTSPTLTSSTWQANGQLRVFVFSFDYSNAIA